MRLSNLMLRANGNWIIGKSTKIFRGITCVAATRFGPSIALASRDAPHMICCKWHKSFYYLMSYAKKRHLLYRKKLCSGGIRPRKYLMAHDFWARYPIRTERLARETVSEGCVGW